MAEMACFSSILHSTLMILDHRRNFLHIVCRVIDGGKKKKLTHYVNILLYGY